MSLEVLYNCEKDHIRRKEDAVVCTLHCYLTSAGYKCIGNGEQVPACGIQKSDMLPAGWSDLDGIYALMYQRNDSSDTATYLLKVLSVDGSLLVHFLRTSDEKVVDMEIRTEEFTGTDLTSFHSAYKSLELLESRFKSEILASLLPPTAQPSRSVGQNAPSCDRRNPDPLRVPPTRPQADWQPPANPLSIGHDDLNPFGGIGGGGMHFDPFRPGGGAPGFGPGAGRFGPDDPRSGFPRGSIVPGARFDPFRPPGVDPSGNFQQGAPRRFGDPDPDHELPPGFDDDMFM